MPAEDSVSTQGTLATVQFIASSTNAGTTQLDLSDVKVTGANGDELSAGDVTVIGGSVTVIGCLCDFCLHLDEGWNFVSVPKRINGTNDAKTIFNLDPVNETCEYYNASAGSWMNPADIDVVPCQGYWVWKVCEEELCIDFLSTGAITPPMQQLCMGWNMIGHIDTSVMLIDDGTIADFGSMANIEGKFLQIWQWTIDNNWERCYPDSLPEELTRLDYMTPGQGYWIWMTEDSPMSGTP